MSIIIENIGKFRISSDILIQNRALAAPAGVQFWILSLSYATASLNFDNPVYIVRNSSMDSSAVEN